MKSSPLLFTVALVLAAHAIATAGPGDPRLVNGVLEWPRALTNEPFFVVRGDDGVVYNVGIAAARRDGPLAAGARVSVLGLEGRAANEITALGVGAGETTQAALANLQGARPVPAPAVVTAPALVAATTPTVTPAPPVAAVPAGPSTASATPSTPPSVTPPAAPPTPPATAVTPPPAPSIAAIVTPPPVRGAAVTAPSVRKPVVESIADPAAMHASAADDRRWTEISGVVESLVGRTLVLRSDEGRVAVDVSSLSPSLDRMVTPGSTVRVYGIPVEMRFKAIGFFDPGARP
jgi:hypothetical protein